MYQHLAKQILKGAHEPLPFLESTASGLDLKITLICKQRAHVSPFFYQMLSRWLIPGMHLDVKLHFSMDFDGHNICELILRFSSVQELDRASSHLAFVEKEILLGARSPYYARKILEMKGLNSDEKTALIQERLMRLVKRFPEKFGYDLFKEMQFFSIGAKQQFKAVRGTQELCLLITTLYRLRKDLAGAVANDSTKRYVKFKLRPLLLHTSFGLKEVLSVCVGINFLKGHELFEERHFLASLSHLVPGVRSIPSSFYTSEGDGMIQTFYIEVEKGQQLPFSKEELSLMRRELGKELKSRVEQLVPPVFMPRNEEEVMRNILLLSHQLKYTRDLPQMIVSFSEQTDQKLCFTVVIVRVLTQESLSVKELLESSSLRKEASVERVKTVGLLRKRYPKEAAVIRVNLKAEAFLREDFAVDLLKARKEVVHSIEEVFGEVRDFNGGMIAKQTENFSQLKLALGKVGKQHALLLQNFFHSVHPAPMSTTIDPSYLKVLFTMLLTAIDAPKEVAHLETKKVKDVLIAVVKAQESSSHRRVANLLEGLDLPSRELCTVPIHIFDASYTGLIYLNPNEEKQKKFLETLQWSSSKM